MTYKNNNNLFVYTATTNQYILVIFYSVIINTGALKKLTAGFSQYIMYKYTQKGVDINRLTKGSVSVQFGISSTDFIGSIYI